MFVSFRFVLWISLFFGLATSASVPKFTETQFRQVLKELDQKPYEGDATLMPASSILPTTSKYQLQLPVLNRVTQKKQFVTVPVYLPINQNGKDFPIVLIACTIEGASPIEEYLAYRFNLNGFGAAVLDLNSFPFVVGGEGADKIFFDSMFAVHAYRNMIDWVSSSPNFPNFNFKSNQHPIVSYAASNGTLTTLFSTAVDHRIQSSVFVAAVGDISHIFTHTTLKKLQDWTSATAKVEGIDNLDMEGYLEKKFRIDTLNVTPMIETDRVFQVLALQDSTVPSMDQYKIWHSLRHPEKSDVHGNHMEAISYTALLNFDRVVDFYRTTLKKPARETSRSCIKLLK